MVFRVDHEFVTAREPGVAFDFRNNRRVGGQLRLLHDFSSELRAQNAFKSEDLSHLQVSFGVEERQVGADSGSGRRSIQCAIGKDTRMPQVAFGRVRRADKDCAVEVAEFGLRGMGNGAFGP